MSVSRPRLLFALAACTALLLPGCLSRSRTHFPYVHPVPRVNRTQLARARAQEYFVRARDYERRGLPQMAARLYEMAYEFDPQSDILRLLLAQKYIELGKYPQALITIRAGREVHELTNREKDMLAEVYMKLGQFERAVEVIESLPYKDDDNLYSLGLLYESLGEPDRAIDTFLAFLRRNPNARRVVAKTSGIMLRRKQYERADSLLQAALGREGESASLYQLLGALSLARGDTAEAVSRLEKAIAIDSTHEEALQGIAQIHIAREEYKKAIRVYQRLYRTEPWGEVYGKTLVLLYYYDEQYEEALELVQQLLVSSMEDFELHFYMGLIAQEMDSTELARLEFEKAVAIQSSFEDAWKQLCLVSARLDDWDRALGDANRFVAALETKASSWRMLGYVHAGRKEFGEAVEAYQKALSIDTSDTHLWFEYGSALERNKNLVAAATAFRTVLARHPRDHMAANYLGYMWAEHGMHLDSAKALIGLALEEEPDNGAYLDSYAWVLYQLGSYDSALVYMEKALAQIDDDAVVHEHYGDIQMKRGRYADAVAAYEKGLELKPDNEDEIRRKLEQARVRAAAAIKQD